MNVDFFLPVEIKVKHEPSKLNPAGFNITMTSKNFHCEMRLPAKEAYLLLEMNREKLEILRDQITDVLKETPADDVKVEVPPGYWRCSCNWQNSNTLRFCGSCELQNPEWDDSDE